MYVTANAKYVWPDAESCELKSLIRHSEYFRDSVNATRPKAEVVDHALYVLEQAYAKATWTIPDDYDSYERFLEAVGRLDLSSSPGYPHCREAPTNRDWLKHDGIQCDFLQLARLWDDVQMVMAGKYEQYVRVFIKEEPLTQRKLSENRWRLILASSLPVQVFWHMLFDYMNDREIYHSYNLPSQHGFVPVAGGWKLYHAQWRHQGKTHGVDKTAWDWTCPAWLIDAELQLRIRLGRGERMQDWTGHAHRMYRDMFHHPTLILSSGQTLRQTVPGVMKSGCVNTISTNGHCQLLLHVVCCLETACDIYPLPSSCGDDTLQHPKHDVLVDSYRSHGVLIKSISDTAEFMGHEHRIHGPVPLYLYKHLFKMGYVTDDILPQYFDSMARMYTHAEEFYIWEYLAYCNGTPLPLSRQAYMFWYDYEHQDYRGGPTTFGRR